MSKGLPILYAALAVVSFSQIAHSQLVGGNRIGNGFSITPFVSYTSSATIQLDPYSASSFERTITSEVSGGYGYGIAFTKRFFSQDLAIGIAVEYLKIEDQEGSQIYDNGIARIRARIKEVITVVPVELAGYFDLPNFTSDLNIFIGGGIGAYFGDRKRTIINLESQTVSKEPGYGLVVMCGMGYGISENFSGVFEMRFRQGEFRVKSNYSASFITAGGNSFEIDRDLDSKVFIDGLKLSFGLSYRF